MAKRWVCLGTVVMLAALIAACGSTPKVGSSSTLGPSSTIGSSGSTVTTAAPETTTVTEGTSTTVAETSGSDTTEAAAIPPGWKTSSSRTVSIALPADWTMAKLGGANAQALFDELKRTNPKLANALGSASALQDVEFFAWGPARDGSTFIDNLNIRRVSRSGDAGDISTPGDVLSQLSAQYASLGFKVTESKGGMTIAGIPAAYITYEASLKNSAGTKVPWVGQQYLLLTDTDLWVLTFSVGVDSPALAGQVAKSSAESFRAK
jgi:hypothetical protein